jgi:hypothetical protein
MSVNSNTSVITSSSIIDTLDAIQDRFVNQLPLIFTILGSVGFIGDTFTFLQRTLRRNTFCIYSLCGSFIDIINLYVNLFPSYIYQGGSSLSTMTNSQSCKWKMLALVALPQLSMNLLILSLIDRYACTCSLTSPMRKMHQLKVVPYLILITVIISSVMSLYSPIFYDVKPGFGCVVTNPIADATLYIIIHGLSTPLVMFIFVWLTYRNVKQSKQRVVSI